MNTFFTFILGVFVGWLVEWVIDFLYWRRRWAERDAGPSQNRPSRAGASTPHHIEQKSSVVITPDNLKIIKGIGVVIEGILNDAGIYTFEQLGNLSTNDLKQILGNVIQRLADEDSLISQARDLARKKR